MQARIGFLKRKPRQQDRASRREAILRRHRIEQLRLSIKSGEYKVSAHDIAAAMFREGVGRESYAV